MNQIIIDRIKEYSDCTISKITLLENEKELMNCYGLEPLIEGAQANRGFRIPAGKYNLLWHISKRFSKKLPLLYNSVVPKERNILIHAGNYPSDSIGCILVGEAMRVYDANKALVEKSNLALQKIIMYLTKYSGKELKGWEVVIKNNFEDEGEVKSEGQNE